MLRGISGGVQNNKKQQKMDGQKFTFAEALFVSILIFGIGFLLGMWLENYRVSKVDLLYELSEINLLDIKSQEQFLELTTCEEAVNELIDFANRIYDEAKLLDKYESASTINENLVIRSKKYSLLRATLFISTIKTKQRCSSTYDVVTYFYKYYNNTLEERSRQKVFSNYLTELKLSRDADALILIPIAGDLDLVSINTIRKKYNITELPTVLVNEELKITEIEDLKKIER